MYAPAWLNEFWVNSHGHLHGSYVASAIQCDKDTDQPLYPLSALFFSMFNLLHISDHPNLIHLYLSICCLFPTKLIRSMRVETLFLVPGSVTICWMSARWRTLWVRNSDWRNRMLILLWQQVSCQYDCRVLASSKQGSFLWRRHFHTFIGWWKKPRRHWSGNCVLFS